MSSCALSPAALTAEAPETPKLRLVRDGDVIHIGERADMDASRPAVAVNACAGFDDTAMFTDDPSVLLLRQTDEDGVAHTIALSPLMVAKVARLMDNYLIIPPSTHAHNAE